MSATEKTLCLPMIEFEFKPGLITLIDDDYEFLMERKWWALYNNNKIYVVNSFRVNYANFKMYMHHAIMGYPLGGRQIDHINGNSLDNQKHNLRIATIAQNNQNIERINSTGYRGVTYDWTRNKYRAKCNVASFGRFNTALEAALAYDKGVKEIYGPDARTNF